MLGNEFLAAERTSNNALLCERSPGRLPGPNQFSTLSRSLSSLSSHTSNSHPDHSLTSTSTNVSVYLNKKDVDDGDGNADEDEC